MEDVDTAESHSCSHGRSGADMKCRLGDFFLYAGPAHPREDGPVEGDARVKTSIEPKHRELDTIAWAFLRSEFTEAAYRSWPIDRRLDAFLLHRGLTALADDGATCSALLERVLSNLGPARRQGLISEGRTQKPVRARTMRG